MLFFSEKEDEKDDDESEKREDHGDHWEETGGGGVDRSSGPWNKSAPAPAPVVEPVGKFNSELLPSLTRSISGGMKLLRVELMEQFLFRHILTN